MRNFGTSLLIALIVLTLQGYAKDKVLSAELLHDTYVALGFETANGFVGESDEEAFLSARILPQDRRALANIRAALQNWKALRHRRQSA